MPDASDYIIVQGPQVHVPAVDDSITDPVELNFEMRDRRFATEHSIVEFLFRGLRSSRAQVKMNGERIAEIQPHPHAGDGEWFYHSIVVTRPLLTLNSRISFLRTAVDDYYVANVILRYHVSTLGS